jgi:hypothetical protein
MKITFIFLKVVFAILFFFFGGPNFTIGVFRQSENLLQDKLRDNYGSVASG